MNIAESMQLSMQLEVRAFASKPGMRSQQSSAADCCCRFGVRFRTSCACLWCPCPIFVHRPTATAVPCGGKDTIRRYGGSTDTNAPWPRDVVEEPFAAH